MKKTRSSSPTAKHAPKDNSAKRRGAGTAAKVALTAVLTVAGIVAVWTIPAALANKSMDDIW